MLPIRGAETILHALYDEYYEGPLLLAHEATLGSAASLRAKFADYLWQLHLQQPQAVGTTWLNISQFVPMTFVFEDREVLQFGRKGSSPKEYHCSATDILC